MKFSISIRQNMPLLRQADEIFAWYKDKDGLYNFDNDPDLINKEFVLRIPQVYDKPIDWDELATLASHMILTVAVEDIDRDGPRAMEHNIPFYWPYPVTTYEEMAALKSAGVSQVLLSAPLYFDLPTAAKFNIPIRLIANYCQDSIFSDGKSGICGTFIRPEDIPVYEPYVKTIEFVSSNLNQEEGLFKVYKRGTWPGNLNLLLTNLNTHVDNRAFPEDFAKTRVKCKHKCAVPGSACRFCPIIEDFVTAVNQARHEDTSTWEKVE